MNSNILRPINSTYKTEDGKVIYKYRGEILSCFVEYHGKEDIYLGVNEDLFQAKYNFGFMWAIKPGKFLFLSKSETERLFELSELKDEFKLIDKLEEVNHLKALLDAKTLQIEKEKKSKRKREEKFERKIADTSSIINVEQNTLEQPLKSAVKPVEDENKILSNELGAAHSVIKRLKKQKIASKITETEMKDLIDKCRKKNDKVSLRKLGYELGINHETAKKRIIKYGLSEYAKINQ